jgi:hypothetical protein
MLFHKTYQLGVLGVMAGLPLDMDKWEVVSYLTLIFLVDFIGIEPFIPNLSIFVGFFCYVIFAIAQIVRELVDPTFTEYDDEAKLLTPYGSMPLYPICTLGGVTVGGILLYWLTYKKLNFYGDPFNRIQTEKVSDLQKLRPAVEKFERKSIVEKSMASETKRSTAINTTLVDNHNTVSKRTTFNMDNENEVFDYVNVDD